MKADIVDLYYKSLTSEEYKNKTDYIRYRLELKYGKCWSIIIVQRDDKYFSFSFQYADDLLLEFTTPDHHVLAYLSQPAPAPLIPSKIAPPPPPPPVYAEYSRYSPPRRAYVDYPQ